MPTLYFPFLIGQSSNSSLYSEPLSTIFRQVNFIEFVMVFLTLLFWLRLSMAKRSVDTLKWNGRATALWITFRIWKAKRSYFQFLKIRSSNLMTIKRQLGTAKVMDPLLVKVKAISIFPTNQTRIRATLTSLDLMIWCHKAGTKEKAPNRYLQCSLEPRKATKLWPKNGRYFKLFGENEKWLMN